MTNNRKTLEIQSSKQFDIPLRRPMQDIDLSVVISQKTYLDSINLCVSLSGFKDDYVSRCLEIDAAQWSKIKKGSAHFPPNKINELMDICGNEAPLMWMNYSRGYDQPKPLESTTEQKLRVEREKNQELEQKLAHITDFVRNTKSI